MLFVWVISVAVTLLAIVNAALSEGVFGVIAVSLGKGVVCTFYAAALAIAIDAAIALFIRRALPAKWFNHKKAVFKVSAGEKKFYELIKIRKWKDKIPEWGKFTGFSKNEIARPQDNAYLEKYFTELCYGEVIHFISAYAGFLVPLLTPHALLFTLSLPVAIVNMFCNLPSYCILRYNSYKLEVLYKNNERRTAREAAKKAAAAEKNAAAEDNAAEKVVAAEENAATEENSAAFATAAENAVAGAAQ